MDKSEKDEQKREKRDSTPGTSGSGNKRKKVYNVEPRTPLKRQRVPVQRFQSPAEEVPTPAKAKPRDDGELVYKKGIFLAVRGDEGSFYMCRTQQNVFQNTRHFKIQWLDKDESSNAYKFDFLDHTEIECVLTNVKMERLARETYQLPDSEKTRIESILVKALKKEKGEPIDDEFVETLRESHSEEDDEDWEDEEPTPKKAKVAPKSRKSITVALKAGKSKNGKKQTPKTKGQQQKKKKETKETNKKEKKTPVKEKVRGPDRKLKPNPKIKILTQDPLFEAKTHMPFISKLAYQRLAFRAVLQNDLDLLKKLLEDDQHIYEINNSRSIADSSTPLHLALEKNFTEAVSLISKDIQDEGGKSAKRKKTGIPPLLLREVDKGRYNPKFLGIRFVRALTQSRGSREGNDAFMKETDDDLMNLVDRMLMNGVKKETIDAYIATLDIDQQSDLKVELFERISFAVIRGHRELAGKLMDEAVAKGGYGFNFLHKDVLVNSDEDLKTFQSASARKKPFGNGMITPIHCACINPNSKYIEKLLSVEPDFNLEDKFGRKPIHFSAACDGTGPLEVLIKKGASIHEVTRRKFTPLLYACYAGRAQNADFLLKKAKAADVPVIDKWGSGGINRPNWESVCPIHVVAENGDMETLNVLLKYGADVNKPLSAGKNKATPLMLAAARGHLEICRRLVQSGATVEQLDKFKRSALTHAVMNGNTNVTSYLLYLGADPDRVDSSGNSLVHYAAAYGWYFVLKLLVNEGGADPKVANDWKLTPVGVAYLKGHMGLVDYLLTMPGVDINFKNDNGMTLISVACSSQLDEGLYEQINYIINKGADPAITDKDGWNALHHVAANTVKHHKKETQDLKMDTTLKIAQLLLKSGCDSKAKTEDGQTAITLAISKVNIKLVKFLVESGGSISAEKNGVGQNALHLLANQCVDTELSPLLKILATESVKSDIKENGLDEKMEVDTNDLDSVKDPEDNVPSLKKQASLRSSLEVLKHMVTEVDNEGYTPLLLACKMYMECKKNEPEAHLKNCLDFMKTLIDLTEVDCSQTVQKKYTEEDNQKEEYSKYGKYSMVHFMVQSQKTLPDSSKNNMALEFILNYKPDLEQRNMSSVTPLILAVQVSNLQAVKLLLDAGAKANVTFPLDKETEETLITLAANKGQREIVKLLLQAGADAVNSRNSKTKNTALHACLETSCSVTDKLEICRMLLEAGADINAVDKWKRTPLHMAVSHNAGTSNASTDIEEFLIERKANMFQKCSLDRIPLHYAFDKFSSFGDSKPLDPIELCSVLTAAMGDTHIDDPDKNCQSPLHLAAQRGATICCAHLVQRKAEINRRDHNGNTPLSFAIKNGHDSCAIVLIQKGANVKEKVVFAPTVYHEETEKKKEVKKPIWLWKPTKNLEQEERVQYSIFQESIRKELQGVAHMVLDAGEVNASTIEAALRVNKFYIALRLLKRIKDNSKIQMLNEKRQNLFHILALHTTAGSQADLQMKVAQMLLEKGVSFSQTDENGCVPLHYAALNHQPYELGKFYVENDKTLEINRKDKFDRTVLAAYLWSFVNHDTSQQTINWLNLLLSKGASFNMLYDFPLPDVPLFDVQSQSIPDYFTTASAYRISPLIFAITHFKFGLAQFFLQHEASENFTDSNGLTPLMHAVKKNDVNMVKILLNHSFDPEKTDDKSPSKLPGLSKRLSRNVFCIQPITEAESEKNDNDDEEDCDDDGGDDEDEQDDDENEQDDNENDDAEEDENAEAEENEEDNDEPEDDDDDDNASDGTDIVEDEEEENAPEKFPSLVRLGSKQASLLRQGSSLTKKDEFPTIEKTSQVNVNETDRQGWTALHHLVCPLDYGTYDNEEILYVLAKAGADIYKKDNVGLSPLDYALMNGASKLTTRLQKISGVEEGKMEKPTFARNSDGGDTALDLGPVDYQADAEAKLKELDEGVMDTEEKGKPIVLPDEHCNNKSSGEVVMDDSQGIPYDVLLSKIDVSMGSWGMYNFYKMQIIWQKGIGLYVLFTRWGRIGSSGQYQHTPFQKKSEAVTEFAKIFRSKTGNYWSNILKFENHPKKYRLIHRENKPAKAHKVDFSLRFDIPSKLPSYVQDLMKEMTNVSMLDAAAAKAGLDSELMPFGRIKKEALIEGRKILQSIGELIKKNKELTKNFMSTQDTEKYQQQSEEISKLTNEYYQFIPQQGYAFEKVMPIDNEQKLKEKLGLVHDLLDLECANRIVLGAQTKLSSMNSLDYIYQAIGCKIELVNEDSMEAQYILKYIYSSCSRADVQAIYKLSRPGEEERIRSTNLENHKLLWHGSSLSNFISILHRGLLVAPPEVPITGHLFGMGIYSADAFAKSEGYSYNPSPTSDTRLALLCQVALGKSLEDFNRTGQDSSVDFTDSDYKSKLVVGKKLPDKDFDVTTPNGCVMPLGMLKDTPKDANQPNYHYGVRYNEYIVQDPSQICLRYLVQFTKVGSR